MLYQAIHAPVYDPCSNKWLLITFFPGEHDNEPCTLENIEFEGNDTSHLNSLKTFLHQRFFRFISGEEFRACPKIYSSTKITLGTTHDRSWELAYAMSCLQVSLPYQFDHAAMYIATGEIGKDGKISAEDLQDKLEYILKNHSGNIKIFLPNSSIIRIEDKPAGVEIYSLNSIIHLLNPGMPFEDESNRTCFSLRGLPEGLKQYENDVKVFSTRQPSAKELVKEIKENEGKLWIIYAPIGWGKTSFVSKVLSEYKQPIFFIDLSSLSTPKESLKNLMNGINISDDEISEIDQSIKNENYDIVIHKITEKLGFRKLLFYFCDGSLNSNLRLNPNFFNLFKSIVLRKHNCIVELWNFEGYDTRGISESNIIKWDSHRIPELSQEEVKDWFKIEVGRDASGDELEELNLLNGYPLPLKRIFEKIDKDFYPQSVPKGFILNRACEWSDTPRVENYKSLTESIIGPIPEELALMIGLIPNVKINPDDISPEKRKYLQNATALGLFKKQKDRIGKLYLTAGGWIKLLSYEYLMEQASSSKYFGEKTDDFIEECLKHVKNFEDNSDLEDTERYLASLWLNPRNPVVKDFSRKLWEKVKQIRLEEDKQCYIPPVEWPFTQPIEKVDQFTTLELVFLAEQAVRNQLKDEAIRMLNAIFAKTREDSLIEALNDWKNLKVIDRILFWLYRSGDNVLSFYECLNERLEPIVRGIVYGDNGRQPLFAYLLSTYTHAIDAALSEGKRDVALGFHEKAETFVRLLKEPSSFSWKREFYFELVYRYNISAYKCAEDYQSKTDFISKATEIALSARLEFGHYSRWNQRVVYCANTLINLKNTIEEEHHPGLFEALKEILFESFIPPRDLLKVFFKLGNIGTEEPEKENKEIRKLLEKYYADNKESSKSYFALQIGIRLKIDEAYRLSTKKIYHGWLISGDEEFNWPLIDLTREWLCWDDKFEKDFEISVVKKLLTEQEVEGNPRELLKREIFNKIKKYQSTKLQENTNYSLIELAILLMEEKQGTFYNTILNKIYDLEAQKAINRILNTYQKQIDSKFRMLTEKYIDPSLFLEWFYAEDTFQKRLQHLVTATRQRYKHLYRDTPQYKVYMQRLRYLYNKGRTENIINICMEKFPTRYEPHLMMAKIDRYFWDYDKFFINIRNARKYAHTVGARLEVDSLYFQILSEYALTPEILRSAFIEHKEYIPRLQLEMREIGKELEQRHSDELVRLWAGLAWQASSKKDDEKFWKETINCVEKRFGPPGEFWRKVSQLPYISDDDRENINYIFEAIKDLTDETALILAGRTLLWGACEGISNDINLKQKLAETAFIVNYSSFLWRIGSEKIGYASSKWRIATSIAIGLLLSEDGKTFCGTEFSPERSRRGNFHPWGQLMHNYFNNLREIAIGKFKQHVEIVSNKLRQQLQYRKKIYKGTQKKKEDL
jgi:hypothetical protein